MQNNEAIRKQNNEAMRKQNNEAIRKQTNQMQKNEAIRKQINTYNYNDFFTFSSKTTTCLVLFDKVPLSFKQQILQSNLNNLFLNNFKTIHWFIHSDEYLYYWKDLFKSLVSSRVQSLSVGEQNTTYLYKKIYLSKLARESLSQILVDISPIGFFSLKYLQLKHNNIKNIQALALLRVDGITNLDLSHNQICNFKTLSKFHCKLCDDLADKQHSHQISLNDNPLNTFSLAKLNIKKICNLMIESQYSLNDFSHRARNNDFPHRRRNKEKSFKLITNQDVSFIVKNKPLIRMGMDIDSRNRIFQTKVDQMIKKKYRTNENNPKFNVNRDTIFLNRNRN